MSVQPQGTASSLFSIAPYPSGLLGFITIPPAPVEPYQEPVNADVAVAFFEQLFSHDREGWAKLAARTPDNPRRCTIGHIDLSAPDRADSVRRFVATHIDHANVYINIAVFTSEKRWNPQKQGRNGAKGAYEWRSKAMVKHCRWAIAERDSHERGRDVPHPTIVVRTSAGRYQDWYELAEPVSGDAVQELNVRLASASGFGNEAIDCVRELRLPGTRNRKPERRGEVVTVITHTRTVFLPDDFLHLPLPAKRTRHTGVPRVSAAPNPPAVSARHVVTPIVTTTALEQADGAVAWAAIGPQLSPRMLTCARGEAVVRAAGSPYASPSNADQALMTAMLRVGRAVGLSDAAVGAAFLLTTRAEMLVERKGAANLHRLVITSLTNADAELARDDGWTWSGVVYAALDRALLDHTDLLGPNGVAVYAVLASHADRGGRAWPSQERIARLLALSAGEVNAQVKMLRRLGLMRHDGNRKRQHIHALTRTQDEPLCIPQAHLSRAATEGADALAILVLIAFHADNLDTTAQAAVASALGKRRQHLNRAFGQLVTAGIIGAHKGARGRLTYHVTPVEEADDVVSATQQDGLATAAPAPRPSRPHPQRVALDNLRDLRRRLNHEKWRMRSGRDVASDEASCTEAANGHRTHRPRVACDLSE